MFKLTKIRTDIYHLQFDSAIELTAHFLRYQEYYESPEFARCPFQLMDYIKWYISQKKGSKSFTYFEDWVGFNFPLEVIFQCYPSITDKNDHDELMFNIARYIAKDTNGKPYLIGSTSSDQETLNHELAHGLYYTELKYQVEMDDLISGLDTTVTNYLTDFLLELGYESRVFPDEIQAFLATGLAEKMVVSEEVQQPFIEIFKKWVDSQSL